MTINDGEQEDAYVARLRKHVDLFLIRRGAATEAETLVGIAVPL